MEVAMDARPLALTAPSGRSWRQHFSLRTSNAIRLGLHRCALYAPVRNGVKSLRRYRSGESEILLELACGWDLMTAEMAFCSQRLYKR